MASSMLIQGVIDVSNGKIFLPSVIAAKFFDYFQKSQEQEKSYLQNEDNLLNYLTQREEEVLELLTEGISYKEVATRLFISDTTVKTHVNNIFQKLQVSDKTQAVLYAINNGLLNKTRAGRAKVAV